MNLNITIFKAIDYILVIVIAVAVFWLANTYIKNQAIDGCAQSYRYSAVLQNDNATVTYPMTVQYKQCLKDKGIK